MRDAAAETLVTWASLPDTADARHRFDDHSSDYLVCQVGGRSLRIAQNRARQGELGVTGCCVWDAAVVLARYFEWAEELRESKTGGQAWYKTVHSRNNTDNKHKRQRLCTVTYHRTHKLSILYI